MTLHVFGAVATANGTAANNRGPTEGHVATLQKLVWNGSVHTTVSAEAIRFALRCRLEELEQSCNRHYDEERRANFWSDPTFQTWSDKAKEVPFADDDLLGFMAAEGARSEGEKGTSRARRAVLELTRAVSLTPWPGDVTFNTASPGASPSAQKKGNNPVPYATEMHATRYQYGFAMTPARLRVAERAQVALRGLGALGQVAGNHSRFLFDFSPESIVLRVTHDPAPRILYAFSLDDGKIGVPELVRKVRAGDVRADELAIGGLVVEMLSEEERGALDKARLHAGVVGAIDDACGRIGAAK